MSMLPPTLIPHPRPLKSIPNLPTGKQRFLLPADPQTLAKLKQRSEKRTGKENHPKSKGKARSQEGREGGDGEDGRVEGEEGRTIEISVNRGGRKRKVEVLEEDVVGRLEYMDGGRKRVFVVTFDSYFIIGRQFDCDLVIPSPTVSKQHLKFHAVKTDTPETLICIQDLSTNGFLHNALHRKGQQGVVLCHGDEVGLLGTAYRFKFYQSERHRYFHTSKSKSPPFPRLLGAEAQGSSGRVEKVRIGGYEVFDRPLGSGSYGIVNLAEDINTRIQVACKTVKIQRDEITPQYATQLQPPSIRYSVLLDREIAIGRKVDHPNLNRILDVVEGGEKVYLFCELVTGGDLFSYLEKHGRFQEEEVKFFAFQLMKGLAYLHSKGIVHRDLKPENICLIPSPTGSSLPRLLITDFGLATEINYGHSGKNMALVRRTTLLGSEGWMPPEMLRSMWKDGSGEGYDGMAVDAWGLGNIIFTCLSGHSDPFMQDTRIRDPGMWEKYSKIKHGSREAAEIARNGDKQQREMDEKEMGIIFGMVGFVPQDVWVNISDDAKNLIRRLLLGNPSKRMTVPQALRSAFIMSSIEELEQLYDVLVTKRAGRRGSS